MFRLCALVALLFTLIGAPSALALPLALPVVAQVDIAQTEAPPVVAPSLPEEEELPVIEDADIETFVVAYQAVLDIQQQAEVEMAAQVEAEGLSVERFGEIADDRQGMASPEMVPVTEAETDSFTAAVEAIIAIRQAAEVDMQASIETAGLSVDEFNLILATAEIDADLRQRIVAQFALEAEGQS